ncbi:MAG: hypothetical protein ACXADW_23875 [Candidatus Hodarchaeales archaeon]
MAVFDDLKFYSAAFIIGILIGAFVYRELQKRFYQERSTPISIVIDQTVIGDNVASIFNLIEKLTRTLNEIQGEADTISNKISRIADMEKEKIKEDDEAS